MNKNSKQTAMAVRKERRANSHKARLEGYGKHGKKIDTEVYKACSQHK